MTSYLQRLVNASNTELTDALKKHIEHITYLREGGITTCHIHLINGFVVDGKCFGYDAHRAREFARKKAVAQLLFLEQYLATERLYQDGKKHV